MRFFMFMITFTSLYTGMHVYAFLKLRRAVALSGIFTALMVAFMLLMILTPILVRVVETAEFEKTAKVFASIGYTWMGFLLLLVSAFLALDLWRFLVYATEGVGKVNLDALRFSARTLFFLPLFAAVLAAGYGLFEAWNIRTESGVIKSSKIAKPIRIAQISDVHLGLLIREARLERILDKVRAASPDLLVSTGDLVDGQTASLNGVGNLLKEVKAPLGKFAVTGNHELYAGLERSLDFMKQAGFRVLRGEGTSVAGLITSPTANAGSLDCTTCPRPVPNMAAPIFTGSMRSWMGAPRVSGVCPRCLSTSICPAAVPPPWLPIAGRMTGVASFCFTAATTAPSTARMQPTPRLPAVTSTVWPGLTLLSRPARASWSADPGCAAAWR